MSARFILALVAFLLAMAGHTADRPAMLAVGLAGLLPLAAKVFLLPARARGAFAMSAVVAGLFLAGLATGQHGAGVDQRPVPAACVEAAQ